MVRRPRTGEPRQRQRTLKLDVLISAQPAVRDAILGLRDQGATWPEIAEQSARPWSKDWDKDRGGFIDWDSLPTPALEVFPDLRLPQTTLQRWFDLRVNQVRSQVLKESERARSWAREFASKSLPDANAAVINALRDQVFEMMRSVGRNDQATFVKGLQNLTLAMSRMQRVELQAKRVEVDQRKIRLLEDREALTRKKLEAEADKAVKKLEKGKLTKQDLAALVQRTFGIAPEAVHG